MAKRAFDLMNGEWAGTGTMTVGEHEGSVVDYVKLEPTDTEDCFSYVRQSRITFPDRMALHDEVCYMRLEDMGLMLSRGSYVILDWDDECGYYKQVASSPDSRGMTRKVQFPSSHEMIWDNDMEVNQRGHWVRHLAVTRFISISRI